MKRFLAVALGLGMLLTPLAASAERWDHRNDRDHHEGRYDRGHRDRGHHYGHRTYHRSNYRHHRRCRTEWRTYRSYSGYLHRRLVTVCWR